MKKIITVLLLLTLCSFLIFASDKKTRIGTNATLSSMYIPYGEDQREGYSSAFRSGRFGIDLTLQGKYQRNYQWKEWFLPLSEEALKI